MSEDPAWLRPSPRLWSARRLVLAAVVLPVAIAGAVVAGLAGGAVPAGVTGGVLLMIGLTVFVLLRGRYRSWRYAERDSDLLVSRGLLVRRLSVVPYGRMQFVDVTAGPVDRIFGLATVQLHTAAARSDARIPGLPRAEAERLRDQLSALGEAQAAGL